MSRRENLPPDRYAHPVLQDILTRSEAATELGVSMRTLDRWEAMRFGPPRIKVGRLILYRRDALREWLASHETRPVAAGKPR